ARANGTLFGSYDDGKTWPWKLMYYEGGSGYSDACVLPDGRVAVLFEKDGKSNLGFTIVPAPPATPPGNR
nr:exo-alpha-sialidase [Akkermansiaceae bacterium]